MNRHNLENLENKDNICRQAGAELGQAQLLLELLVVGWGCWWWVGAVGGGLGMLSRFKLALLNHQCFVRLKKTIQILILSQFE